MCFVPYEIQRIASQTIILKLHNNQATGTRHLLYNYSFIDIEYWNRLVCCKEAYLFSQVTCLACYRRPIHSVKFFTFSGDQLKYNGSQGADRSGQSHSMKNGLETRQSQRTSVLSLIITWEYVGVS